MKIWTSYFYQIRFFKPYMIPLSTAVGDPFWYHDGYGKTKVFIDKNGVCNGLKIYPLVPGSGCSNLCSGMDKCETLNPDECAFLKKYYEQLRQIDFKEFMGRLDASMRIVADMLNLINEPMPVFIVHEAPSKRCSERIIIHRWLSENGVYVEELNPKSGG